MKKKILKSKEREETKISHQRETREKDAHRRKTPEREREGKEKKK